MRAYFVVAALLLVGLTALPSASAGPNCLDNVDPVGCGLEYGQGRIDYIYDAVEDAWETAYQPVKDCLEMRTCQT